MKYFRKFEKEVDFHNSDLIYPTVSFTADSDNVWYYDEDFIIMTSASNPEVMAICYNQGWAKNQDYMYRSEAEAVTDIGTAFNNGSFHSYTYNNFIYSFDEFKYFTGVTTIQQNAFDNQYELKSIKLPSSLLNINERAFNGCEKLNEIILPENLSYIGYWAFAFTKNIGSINIPKNALFESNLFGGGHNDPSEYYYLDYITVDDEHSVFSDLNCNVVFNKKTKELIMGCGNSIIPSSVKSINSKAFSHCRSITNIIFEEGSQCETIGYHAFYGCKNLKSITLPNTITSIGESAFDYCRSLTSITIGNSVESIGKSAFYGCSSLTSITIPESVTSIGNFAFYGCYSLREITIPNNVTSIGERAFYGCYSLREITIPNNVTSIGERAFYGCYFKSDSFINNSSLDAEANGYWGATIVDEITEDGLYIKNNRIVFCNETSASVTIPNGVTSIGGNAFYDCSSLTSITIPNSVTSIDSYAFTNCSSLSSITIPESVTSIGSNAFYLCSFTSDSFINNSRLNAEANGYWGATIVN